MTVVRLKTIVQVIRLWPFFREGIEYEAKYLRYDHTIDVYRRILFSLVKSHETAWVGILLDSDESQTPLAFILSHDVTPLHADKREFEVSMFYYRPGKKHSLRVLQSAFDDFCRLQQVHRYFLTTSSFCSNATRVFKDAWIGLERSNTVFKRNIT